jgi:hypothetical protein
MLHPLMNSLAFLQPVWLNSSVVAPLAAGRSAKVIRVSIHAPGPWTTRHTISSGVSETTSTIATVSLPSGSSRPPTGDAVGGGDQIVPAGCVDADAVQDVGHCSFPSVR